MKKFFIEIEEEDILCPYRVVIYDDTKYICNM